MLRAVRDNHSGVEGSQIKLPNIDHLLQGRIGRIDQLEAAVASIAVDDVGAHSAAYRIRCFEYHDIDAGAGQPLSASQASQSRADDDDVGRVDQARPSESVGIGWSSAGHADAVMVAPHALSAATSTARTIKLSRDPG